MTVTRAVIVDCQRSPGPPSRAGEPSPEDGGLKSPFMLTSRHNLHLISEISQSQKGVQTPQNGRVSVSDSIGLDFGSFFVIVLYMFF